MENKDYVKLDIEKYTELYDFKKEMERGKTCIRLDSNWNGYREVVFYNPKDAIQLVIDRNEKLNEKIDDLKSEIDNLKNPPKKKSCCWFCNK